MARSAPSSHSPRRPTLCQPPHADPDVIGSMQGVRSIDSRSHGCCGAEAVSARVDLQSEESRQTSHS